MTRFHAEDDIVDLVRDHGPAGARQFDFGDCTRLDANGWQCPVAWRSSKRVYRGRASVQHFVNGFDLDTTGQFLGRSWRRSCVRRDSDRLGRFKARGCSSRSAVVPPTTF
jgi:hypothetical protein